MRRRVILDLCGGTGAWSAPYRHAVDSQENPVYRVVNVTLPHYDVTKTTITDRQLVFQAQTFGKQDVAINLVNVHGVLAAPPCTQFSLANTRQTYALRPDWATALVPVQACESIIRACMCKGYTKFWALENPFGHLRKFLGVPRYTFEAWWYDENAWVTKKTDLWGFFNAPKRTVFDRPARLSNAERDRFRHQPGWYTPEVPAQYAHLNLSRAEIRAITPTGFAQAFMKANR